MFFIRWNFRCFFRFSLISCNVRRRKYQNESFITQKELCGYLYLWNKKRMWTLINMCVGLYYLLWLPLKINSSILAAYVTFFFSVVFAYFFLFFNMNEPTCSLKNKISNLLRQRDWKKNKLFYVVCTLSPFVMTSCQMGINYAK